MSGHTKTVDKAGSQCLDCRCGTVATVRWFGSSVLELTCKDVAGWLGNQLLYRDVQSHLCIALNLSEKFTQTAVDVEGGAANNLNVVGHPLKAEPDFGASSVTYQQTFLQIWQGSSDRCEQFLQEVQNRRNANEAQVMQQVLGWAEQRGLRMKWGNFWLLLFSVGLAGYDSLCCCGVVAGVCGDII
jgi:hypothetical protein